MARCGRPGTSTGLGGTHFSLVMATAALILALVLPVTAQERCKEFNCNTKCDEYPQDCDACCRNNENGGDSGKDADINKKNGGDSGKDADINKRMAAMETAIKDLRVMVGVILALFVVQLLVAFMVMILRHTCARTLKGAIPVFFRSKDEGRASIEKRPPPTVKVPNENRNSTVVRIADYQNNHSPLTKRMRPNGQQVFHEDSAAEHNFSPPVDVPRPRCPSESTCPDDSAELPHPHQHAYDNLALSTSTLHDTTTSSTSTLGPAVSTNTLETTLPSVNPSSPRLV